MPFSASTLFCFAEILEVNEGFRAAKHSANGDQNNVKEHRLIDAMGCQKKIATEICNADADYVLALKSNLLKADSSKKVGIKAKQKNAGWDLSYLLSLLKF